jgi:hypothetical protein
MECLNMPVDMASVFSSGITLPSLGVKIPEVTQTIKILQETWDAQTFGALLQGKVSVPDDVLNKGLAAAIEEGCPVKELTVTSQENHQIKIVALTAQNGRVVLVCTVEQFEHNKDHSFIKMKVTDKKLPDRPVVSWIFSRVSLAMVSKLAGNIVPGDGLTVAIHGNEVTVDFHQALYASRFAGIDLFGYKPLDALTISGLTPQKGYVEMNTDIDLPDNIKAMIQNVLQ